MKKNMKYDEALCRLEELVSKVEDPSSDLSSIASDIKEAMEIVKWCRAYIKGNQEEIDKLLEDEK